MPDLKNIQTTLSAIFCKPDKATVDFVQPGGMLTKSSALKVYQNGYEARLTEAMGSTFESVWYVLGDHGFFEICREYIQGHASSFYNLSDYGADFPEFLASTTKVIDDFPFLKDLADFEWTFKDVFHLAQHEAISQSEFTKLAGAEDFKFVLAANVCFLKYEAPVFEIWKLRKSQDVAAQKNIVWEHRPFLIMYKQEGLVRVKELESQIWQLLRRLQQGLSFNEAVTACAELNIALDPTDVTSAFQFLAGAGIVTALSIL